MSNLILKDESVETTHGYYECPECEATFYAGGLPLHKPSCSKAGEDRYAGLIQHVGPNCPEYTEAVEDLWAAAFNLGYDAYPEDKHLFGVSGRVAQWYIYGWENAEAHNVDGWVCVVCGQEFDDEPDFAAHVFNSSCEKEIEGE